VPVVLVTVLFKMEGQHDFWFVAAWLPLWLTAAVGLHAAAGLVPARPRLAIAAIAAAGAIWSIGANVSDLSLRRYTLPEKMARFYLEPLDPGALVVLRSDNVLATTLYLQQVKGVRPDVVIVPAPDLENDEGLARLIRRHPFLRPAAPSGPRRDDRLAAFANANGLLADHPLYFEAPPPGALLRPDRVLMFAGAMQKIVARGREGPPEEKYWQEPIRAEELVRLDRRQRAQFNEYRPDGVRVRPETCEHRFLRDLLRARKHLADWTARAGTPEAFRRSAEIYEGILALDPWMHDDPGAVYPLAGAYFGMKRYDLAEPWLLKALQLELPPEAAAQVCGFLAVLCRDTNRPDEAARWQQRAQGRR